jgi:hypothetical protein
MLVSWSRFALRSSMAMYSGAKAATATAAILAPRAAPRATASRQQSHMERQTRKTARMVRRYSAGGEPTPNSQ